MAKHKPYTPECKLRAVLDPEGSTCLALEAAPDGLAALTGGIARDHLKNLRSSRHDRLEHP